MGPKQAKDTLCFNPPNIPDTHWELLVHNAVLNGTAVDNKITLTHPNSAELTIDPMSGNAIVTLQLNISIESVNSALWAFDVPTTGWSIKE